MHNKAEQGFTLIELVVVIVILGILAAAAAPRFIDISSDAKASVLQGIAGSMRSGMQMVHAKAILAQQLGDEGLITIDGVDVPLHNGYPRARGGDSFADINQQLLSWIELDMVDRNTAKKNRNAAQFFSDRVKKANTFYVFFTEDYDQKNASFGCHVRYRNDPNGSGDAPVVEVFDSDC